MTILNKTSSLVTKSISLLVLVFLRLVCFAQTEGCPDPAASNYSPTAKQNDGSCRYNNASVNLTVRAKLSATIKETSGLLFWNGLFWTHNDSGGEPALYQLDSATGNIKKKVTLTNATNIDWEDIAQDDSYIYIGDFGNNASGNRTNLTIYKVSKNEVKRKTNVRASAIHFSYSDQTNLAPANANTTNFDCEAMIAYRDSLFLFSKDWSDNKTRMYKLPKKAGTYKAIMLGELDVQGLVTGADVIASKHVIVLTGYNKTLSPFLYLLYDFTGNRFFEANKRKIQVNQNLLQMEGICAIDNTHVAISNETFHHIFNSPARLQTVDLSPFLSPYYSKQSIKTKNITR